LNYFEKGILWSEVDRLKTIVSLLLLVLWVPVTSHCYLEMAGVIPQDNCCSQGESKLPAKGDPCESGCKIVEKAGYKIQDNRSVLPVVVLLLPSFLQPARPAPPAEGNSARIVAWPPDTLRLPQFIARTALPVRAPSSAS
jgi:hypothetical protein